MGAGEGKVGVGRIPYLPVTLSPSVDRPSPLLVPKYDLETRSYPLLSDGRVEGIHPVVQQAAHALGFRRRALASAKNVGTDFVKIGLATRQEKAAVVRTEVDRALERLVKRGDIVVASVEIEQPAVSGRTFYTVTFVNLRDPARPKVSLKVED